MVMTTPQNVHKLMHSNELISLDLSFCFQSHIFKFIYNHDDSVPLMELTL